MREGEDNKTLTEAADKLAEQASKDGVNAANAKEKRAGAGKKVKEEE